MLISILVIASIGLLLSTYGFYIEQKLKKDTTYKPLCDISPNISCSKPFLSPYGKIITNSNTALGMFFYSMLIVLGFFEYREVTFMFTFAGIAMSLVFAYILYFKIKTVCLLCSAIYIVNIALFIAAYQALQVIGI